MNLSRVLENFHDCVYFHAEAVENSHPYKARYWASQGVALADELTQRIGQGEAPPRGYTAKHTQREAELLLSYLDKG